MFNNFQFIYNVQLWFLLLLFVFQMFLCAFPEAPPARKVPRVKKHKKYQIYNLIVAVTCDSGFYLYKSALLWFLRDFLAFLVRSRLRFLWLCKYRVISVSSLKVKKRNFFSSIFIQIHLISNPHD